MQTKKPQAGHGLGVGATGGSMQVTCTRQAATLGGGGGSAKATEDLAADAMTLHGETGTGTGAYV